MIMRIVFRRIMKNIKCDETLDRLSELPDSVILQILSFLEMRDVVRTTVLSKRWQHLWTTIPCLNFFESEKSAVETRNFVNRALMLWKGARILKFKIDLEDSFYDLGGDIELWLRFVAERNVEELYVHLNETYDTDYVLPQFLLSCSSITKLSLVGCAIQPRGVLHWHQLKNLKFHLYSISEDVIDQIVSSTPRLEIFDLSIWSDSSESEVNLSFRSSSLKKLSITCSLDQMICDLSLYPMLTIWAPNLEVLVISGPPYSTCLMNDVSSLTDVKLDFSVEWDVVLRETLRQILPTFQHVETVTLSSCCFKVLQLMKGKYSLSPLPNVKQLRFTCDLIEPYEVVGLLEIFPQLKMLEIDQRRFVYYSRSLKNINSKKDIGESLGSEENIIKSFMMQLRIVKIGWHMYETSIYQFIEFFLKHATMLEKIVIQKRGDSRVESEDMILAAEKLLSLQRSFPTVELIFCQKRCYRSSGEESLSVF